MRGKFNKAYLGFTPEDLGLSPIEDVEISDPTPEVVADQVPDGELVVGTESFNMMSIFGKHLQMRAYSATSDPRSPVLYAPKDDGGVIFTTYVFGTIENPTPFGDLIAVLQTATEQDEVNIYIHSPGGCVCTGAMIASSIVACKAKVTTIAVGVCASAGSLIWSAGHVCHSTSMAAFMYHMSSHVDMGNSTKIMERAEAMTRYVRECLLVDAVGKGHITAKELEILSDKDENLWIPHLQMASRLLA